MSNFLDDKLYDKCINTDIESVDDITQLINELYDICHKHYVNEITPGASKKYVKSILDRTFNSWDLFMTRLDKSTWLYRTLLKDYSASYKETFMSTPNLKQAYDGLSK